MALYHPPPIMLASDISERRSLIYRMAIRNKWILIRSKLVQEDIHGRLSIYGDTALHIAVGTNSSHDFVKRIVEWIEGIYGLVEGRLEELRHIQNDSDENALHTASKVGNLRAAKLLLERDPGLVNCPNCRRYFPVWYAAWGNDAETLRYLLSATLTTPDVEIEQGVVIQRDRMTTCLFKEPQRDHDFLVLCIRSGHYDVALFLVTNFPHLIWETSREQETPLKSLASKPDAFRSGNHRRYYNYYFHKFIYSYVGVVDEPLYDPQTYRVPTDIELRSSSSSSYMQRVRDEKLRHNQATRLVEKICSAIRGAPGSTIIYGVLGAAICTAIRYGCHELIEKCIEEFPWVVQCDEGDYNFLGLAIKYRRERVFNLIYQMSSHKINLLRHRGKRLQNALHVAGELPEYDRYTTVTGPALQMQRELLWFEEVKGLVPTSSLNFRNTADKTPREVFTDKHKDLFRDAQEWTKATTASSTVVAALIVTITFAAMFTLPGGLTDGEGHRGEPQFLGRKAFQIFVFTDTAALFFSATAVLSFLSTLTCLTQEGFLFDVPLRLTCAYISLYLSVVASIIAFGATFVLVLYSKVHWIGTMVITVGSLLIILFSWLQFPLLPDLLGATLGKSIFHKQKDLLVH